MTNLTESEKQEVKAVRTLAQANYDKAYGWQVIEECMTDEEIAAAIKRSNKSAAEWAMWFADLQSERCQEIESTRF